MSTDDLKTTHQMQREQADVIAEQADEMPSEASSADLGVEHVIEEYTNLSDTMVAGKTIQVTAVRDTSVGGGEEAEASAGTETAVGASHATSYETKAVPADQSLTSYRTQTIVSGPLSNAANTETEKPEAEPQEGEKTPEEPATDPETEAIKAKIRERKKEKIRKARRRRIRFWTILILFLVSVGAFVFSISGFFTVDSIEVRGNEHFTAEEIINIAHAVPGHNLIYDPDKQEIIDYLEQNPYIKSAEVTRSLPSTLVITVHERAQACAFRYDDDYLIMDDEGILLKKTRTEPKITMLRGMVVSKIKLGEKIGTEDQKLFTSTLKLVRAMKDADLYFVTIDMTTFDDDFQVRAYIYDNLVIRSEYDPLVENLDNGRLHKVVDQLFSDGIQRGTIIVGGDETISYEPGI